MTNINISEQEELTLIALYNARLSYVQILNCLELANTYKFIFEVGDLPGILVNLKQKKLIISEIETRCRNSGVAKETIYYKLTDEGENKIKNKGLLAFQRSRIINH